MRILVNIRRCLIRLIAVKMMRAHRNHTERLLVGVDVFDDAVCVVSPRIAIIIISRTHMCKQVVPPDFAFLNLLDDIPRDEELVCILIDK